MGSLSHNTNWTGSNTQTTQAQTYTFATANTYVDKNIAFTVTAQSSDFANSVPTGTNVTLSSSNTSGCSVRSACTMTTKGWVETKPANKDKYITGVSIPTPASNKNTFTINDGIYTWTYEVDSSGNVTIS